MENLNVKIRNIWVGSSMFIGLILGSIISVFAHAALGIAPVTALFFVLPPILLIMYSVKRYQNWFFQVHNDHLEINKGVVRKVSMVVPYVRVQHIDTNRGPLERMLGLSSLRVYTAGSKGADMRIPGLTKMRAEEMQDELKDKAIESEKGFDAV